MDLEELLRDEGLDMTYCAECKYYMHDDEVGYFNCGCANERECVRLELQQERD